MFKLAEIKSVEWPVQVNIPQDGGRTVTSTFTGIFEPLDQDEIDDILKGGGDLIARAFKGWTKGVADEAGKDIESTPENVARMRKIAYVRAALWKAFEELQNGRAAARKN